MAIIPIIIFCISLIVCLILKINVVFAVIFGFFDFYIYALYKKHPFKEVGKMAIKGYLTCKNVFITFSLIAMLTGLWRCCGTIPAVIYYLLKLVNYKYFLLVTFLLCSFLSIILGSLVATGTTMGVICMIIAKSLGLNEVWIMGAILSGVIVGDRMSTVSTSCLLVADLTGTDMYENIKNMFYTSIIPYILTCVVYYFLGTSEEVNASVSIGVIDMLYDNFHINFLSILPVLSIIVLSFCRVNIRINVLASMIVSVLVGFINENLDVWTLLTSIITGYKSTNIGVAKILNGGGWFSVINVLVLVGFGAAFAGIIRGTDVIDVFNNAVKKVLKKTNMYTSVFIFSTIYSIIGCNQSVPVVLVSQTMGESMKNKKLFALMMENSTIIIPMIIPWNLACSACLNPAGGSQMAVFFAFYIYFLLIYSFIIFYKTKDDSKAKVFFLKMKEKIKH